MNLQDKTWQPSQEDIVRMVAELRPILAELALRDRRRCESRSAPRRCR